MSFSFGFSGDDIDEEEGDGSDGLVKDLAKVSISPHPLLLPAKQHDFKDLLSSLPSRLSFKLLAVTRTGQHQNHDSKVEPAGTTSEVIIARRALFDIRAQLMAEADPLENSHDNLLASLEAGDLASGTYEGGFKTWECALDLASFVGSFDFTEAEKEWHIIELGAGSAIPSLTILSRILECGKDRSGTRIHFSLCDYNEDVLRLATAPNVFLAGLKSLESKLSEIQKSSSQEQEDLEMDDIGEDRIESFLPELQEQRVSFNFVSGAWGPEFLDLIQQSTPPGGSASNILVLASETIYSPDSIQIFTTTLIELLKKGGSHSTAFVAAKRVYFGVGGGVDEFVREAIKYGAIVKEVLDLRTEGVVRVILQIVLAEHCE